MIYIGRQWNETVLVNIGGKSYWDKQYTSVTIHHGVYTEIELLLYFAAIVFVIVEVYLIYRDWKT